MVLKTACLELSSELCDKKADPVQKQKKNPENRNIKLDDLDISDIADSGRELDDKTSFETTMVIVIFIMSCVYCSWVLYNYHHSDLQTCQQEPETPPGFLQTLVRSSNFK